MTYQRNYWFGQRPRAALAASLAWLLFCLLCAAAPARAQSAAGGLTVVADAGITLVSPQQAVRDFGTVSPGAGPTLSQVFQLRNDSAAVVTINRMTPSCHCTSAAIAPPGSDAPPTGAASSTAVQIVALRPGEMAPVRVTVDIAAKPAGAMHEAVAVYILGRTEPAATIEIKAVLAPAETSKAVGPVPAAGSGAAVPPVVAAWGALDQVADALADDVTTKDLASVHNEDSRLYSAVTMLSVHPEIAPADQREALGVAISDVGRAVDDLHTVSDAGSQSQAEAKLKLVQAAFGTLRAYYSPDVLAQGRDYADQYTCPMHADVRGKKGDLCPKCGMPLDQVVRISLFTPSGMPVPHTIQSSIQLDAPLVVGRPVHGLLYLTTLAGQPVQLSALRVAHTRKIHLLIIDSSLTDYHHEHPVPTAIPGVYSFSFTPSKPGPYRAWADLRPNATGFQEYAITDMHAQSAGLPLTDRAQVLARTTDGLHCTMSFAPAVLKAGQPARGMLHIATVAGKPVTTLEPVMAAFAHIVGFHEDYKTVLHIHPSGAEVLDANARGGPNLSFVFYATKPGFYRLFAQMQIAGKMVFVPFGVNVEP